VFAARTAVVTGAGVDFGAAGARIPGGGVRGGSGGLTNLNAPIRRKYLVAAGDEIGLLRVCGETGASSARPGP